MNSQIKTLNEFFNQTDWKITSTSPTLYLNPVLEQVCVFLADNIKSDDVFLGTFYLDEKNNLLNNLNIIAGLFLFIQFSDSEFNLSKIFQNVFEKKIIDKNMLAWMEKCKSEDTSLVKNYKEVVNNFVSNVYNKEQNINSDIVSLFMSKIKVNVVILNDYNINKLNLCTGTLSEYQTISDIFKARLFQLIDKSVKSEDYKLMEKHYQDFILAPYSKIVFGQDWIDSLDSYFTHIIQVEELTFLGFEAAKKNYLTWKNVMNIKALRLAKVFCPEKINSFSDFQKMVNKIIVYIEALKAMNTRQNWDVFGDQIKFVISQFLHFDLPIEFLAQIIIPECSWVDHKLVFNLTNKINEVVVNMYRVVAKYFIVFDYEDEKLVKTIISNAIINTNTAEGPKSLIANIQKFGHIIFKQANLNKESVYTCLDEFETTKDLELVLGQPLLMSKKAMVSIGNLMNLYEIITYNHGFNELSEWAPFIISKHIVPSQNADALPISLLGDVWFLNKSAGEYLITTARARKELDFNKIYFDSCQAFNYLMHDEFLQKLVATRVWNTETIAGRTNKYKKIILDIIQIV